MTQAADQDSRWILIWFDSITELSFTNEPYYFLMLRRFSFEAREWPNGHYIHTLAGKKEEPTLWVLWHMMKQHQFASLAASLSLELFFSLLFADIIIGFFTACLNFPTRKRPLAIN